jgi:hypothetical protein
VDGGGGFFIDNLMMQQRMEMESLFPAKICSAIIFGSVLKGSTIYLYVQQRVTK